MSDIKLGKNALVDRFNMKIASIDYAESIKEVPFFEKKSNVLSQILLPEKQVDLAYGTALYVSEGGNKNGYYFTNRLLLAHYKTVLLKPLNVAHTPEFIVGVIYDSALSKKGDENDPEPKFNLIDSSKVKVTSDKGIFVEGYKGEVDVWTHFVLFKTIYPGVVEVLKDNVSGNKDADDYFISMEIFYDEYKYLWNEDESTAFDRSYQNSYLDEYIGKTFEGRKLFRMYTGPVVFGGGGIVGAPANERSVLADIAHKDVAKSNLSVEHNGDLYKVCSLKNNLNMGQKGKVKEESTNLDLNNNKEESMSEINYAKIQQDIDNSINARMKAIQTETNLDQAQATIQAQKEEISNLAKSAQDISAASETALKEAEVNLAEVQKKLDEAGTKVAGLEKKATELETNQMSEEDKKELAEYKVHKKANERMEDLSNRKIYIPEDKKEEVLTKVGSFTDEQYEAYASALELAGVKPPAETDKDKASKEAANKDKASKKDTNAKDVKEGKDAEKVLSDASGTPDTTLNQDTAGEGAKKTNYMNALRSVTTRSKDNPRGR